MYIYNCGIPTCTFCDGFPWQLLWALKGKDDLVSMWTLEYASPLIQLICNTPLVADILVMEFVQGGGHVGSVWP